MKKIFLTLILCSIAGAMFAQGAKFGVTAGLNVSNITSKQGSISVTQDWKPGFQAGIFMDCGLSENFSIIPELLFSQRGCKSDNSLRDVDMSNSTTLNYVQLPINLAYKFDVSYGQKLFPFVGVYAGYGISGKWKTGESSSDIKFGSADDEMKALDFGANVGLGYQFERIVFKVQYNHGLANLSNAGGDITSTNKNVAVTVGFIF
jgi:hypothetical protein